MAVTTMRARNIVLTAQGRQGADWGGLFSDGEVGGAMHLATHKELVHLLFKSADAVHGTQHAAQLVRRQFWYLYLFSYLFSHKTLLIFATEPKRMPWMVIGHTYRT